MTTPACTIKITTFFQVFGQSGDWDMRDNRGKRHSLALVLTSLVAAFCCGREGNLSRLHQHMTKQFENLLQVTQLTDQKVNGTRWFVVDGKELRGSIPSLAYPRRGVCFGCSSSQSADRGSNLLFGNQRE